MLLTHPNGETIAKTFDGLNRVLTIIGQPPGATGGGASSSSARSSSSSSMNSRYGGYSFGYQYDLASNVIGVTETSDYIRTLAFGYDKADRLVSEQIRSNTDQSQRSLANQNVLYTYDNADNRTQKQTNYLTPPQDPGNDPVFDSFGYTYNNLNQLTQYAGEIAAGFGQQQAQINLAYTYDLNGNRSSRTGAGAPPQNYSYDFENRLTRLVDQAASQAWNYLYDYRTRRVQVTPNPATSGTGPQTSFVFSGGNAVQEWASGALTVENIRGSDMGGGVGGILYTLRAGSVAFTHYNSRADVVRKTASSGDSTYAAAYDAFGTHRYEEGATSDRQKANTKDEDPTGLLNEGFRYRDLETGVFITRDPVGFKDGPNLYAYVHQNPWTKLDPEGLEGFSPDVLVHMEQVGKHLGLDRVNTVGRMAAINFVGDETKRFTIRIHL